MSDYLPLDIQVEIMKRLHVKSLVQFRSVSKTWRSTIDASDFVSNYSRQTTLRQHIFVRYDYREDFSLRYVSIVDDDTFHLNTNRVSLTPPPRFSVDDGECYQIVGSSHGLLCFYSPCEVGGCVILWNPYIRRSFEVGVSNVADTKAYNTIIGFGVCRRTSDPKIVKITCFDLFSNLGNVNVIPSQVEVFRLSTRTWSSLSDNHNLPHTSISFYDWNQTSYSVDIDGIMYWFAINRVNNGHRKLIISFDVASEEFGEVNIPNRLAQNRALRFLNMSKLRESLVLVENNEKADSMEYHVWMMEGGVAKSFTKIFTFSVDTLDETFVMEFRMTGDPIIEIIDNDDAQLVVYEPHSNHMDDLGFDGMSLSIGVQAYAESLFLIDLPNLIVQN